jgi:nitroimidazol reductase NimA-like FMN-containing flavoprotein (pyridoxamine 5'-phosphate oxidase superfamily)
MSEIILPTEKTKLKRIPKRGSFDRATIYQILDEAFVCHVGFTIDGHSIVIPTGYARVGDDLLIHGSAASRMLRAMAREVDVCVTVTLIDGLVLARSAFHHSMNYRSVMIFGKANFLIGRQEKVAALRAFTEHIIPQRWAEVRPPNEQELKATMVLRLPLQEASAKTRTGDPIDDEEDYALDMWAGVIPLTLLAGEPIADGRLKEGLSIPPSVSDYKIRLRANEN